MRRWITQLENNKVIEKGGRIICTMQECRCTRQLEEKELIAAAPEMFDVLKDLMDRLNEIGFINPEEEVNGGDLVEVIADRLSDIRKAIASAEGRE